MKSASKLIQRMDLLLALTILGGVLLWLWIILKDAEVPMSTPIRLTLPGENYMRSSPHELPGYSPEEETTIRIGLAGDIMQHHEQEGDDFQDVYARISPILREFDLAMGNLEFPVSTNAEGSGKGQALPYNATRFNGSAQHIEAIGDAGFDLLSTANNHSYDLESRGLISTLEVLEKNGITPVGTAREKKLLDKPVIKEIRGIRIAFFAATFEINGYPDGAGGLVWPPRDAGINNIYFTDWTREYRAEGLKWIEASVKNAREAGANFLVAVLHWGDEYTFYANDDQRRAAHDMIDAGFDLIVGSHSHVLGEVEIYKGKLISYSLGNLVGAYKPLETRVATILEVRLVDAGGKAEVVDFQFHPTLVDDQRRIVPIKGNSGGEPGKAWALARRALGEGVR